MKHHQELHNLLEEYGAHLRPNSYLEVGVHKGDSVSVLAFSCQLKRIVLCDNWCYDAADEQNCRKRFEGLPVRFLVGNSHVVLKTLFEKFDFITLDGDHSFKGAAQDLEDVWPLLLPGGTLFFDDIFHPKHLDLDACIDLFVLRHADARLERKVFNGTCAPGCAVVRKFGALT